MEGSGLRSLQVSEQHRSGLHVYETKSYYHPQQQCIMISGDSFCAVCRRAIEDIIDLYSRP
jgi:hypothetical protein